MFLYRTGLTSTLLTSLNSIIAFMAGNSGHFQEPSSQTQIGLETWASDPLRTVTNLLNILDTVWQIKSVNRHFSFSCPTNLAGI